jgi:hypothetical protein
LVNFLREERNVAQLDFGSARAFDGKIRRRRAQRGAAGEHGEARKRRVHARRRTRR